MYQRVPARWLCTSVYQVFLDARARVRASWDTLVHGYTVAGFGVGVLEPPSSGHNCEWKRQLSNGRWWVCSAATCNCPPCDCGDCKRRRWRAENVPHAGFSTVAPAKRQPVQMALDLGGEWRFDHTPGWMRGNDGGEHDQ